MQLEQQLYEEAHLHSEPLREGTAVAVFNLVVNFVTVSIEKYHGCELTDTLGQRNDLLLEYLFITNSTLFHTVLSCMLHYYSDEDLSEFAQDNGRFLLFLLKHRCDVPELNQSTVELGSILKDHFYEFQKLFVQVFKYNPPQAKSKKQQAVVAAAPKTLGSQKMLMLDLLS